MSLLFSSSSLHSFITGFPTEHTPMFWIVPKKKKDASSSSSRKKSKSKNKAAAANSNISNACPTPPTLNFSGNHRYFLPGFFEFGVRVKHNTSKGSSGG